MNTYLSFSDDELIEAYTSMISYSGKITDDLQFAIDQRGGMESFKKQMGYKKIHQQEIKRISGEVFALTSEETNVDFVKKLITSNILSKEELASVVEKKFKESQEYKKDREVSTGTLTKSLLGLLAGLIVGGTLWALSIYFFEEVYYLLIVPIYIINYFLIRLITKQSRANPVVFLACLFSTVGSVVIGYYILAYIVDI